MTDEPTDDEIRRLNQLGGELADELLALLRPATDEYSATLSALQLVVGRTVLEPAELLDVFHNLVRHSFPQCSIVVAVPAEGEDNAPPETTKH